MLDLSMEQLNAFQDAYYDEQPGEPGSALEQLYSSTGIQVGCHQDLMKLREAFKKLPRPMNMSQSYQEEPCEEAKPKPPTLFVAKGATDYVLTIDFELMFALIFAEKELGIFIQQLHSIPASATLHVIPMMMGDEIDPLMLFEGTAIINMIRSLPCRKVFSFNSMMSIPDLTLAMCCDDIEVGDYAAVSLTKAENGEFITKYIIPVYQHLVKSVFSHWINKGLLTQKEVDNLYTDEADHDILLLSDEIRRRLSR